MDKFEVFTNIPNTMIKADFLSTNDFRVIAVLHSMNFDKKEIFPSQELLVKKTGLSVATVKRCLAKLADQGVITKTQKKSNGKFSSNQYVFVCGGWNKWYASKHGNLAEEDTEFAESKVSETELNAVSGIKVVQKPEPYVRIQNEFLYCPKFGANELRVFLLLSTYSGCISIYPKYDSLCKQSNLSKPSVISAITSLSELGLVHKVVRMKQEGGYNSNEYIIKNFSERTAWLRTQAEE